MLDKPVQKPPLGRAIEHVLPVGVVLKLAVSPSSSLIETLHREGTEGTFCSKHRRTQSPWGPVAPISFTPGAMLYHFLTVFNMNGAANHQLLCMVLTPQPVTTAASPQERKPSQERGIRHTTGQENIVSTRSGHMKESDTISIHTKAASVANLVPSAT